MTDVLPYVRVEDWRVDDPAASDGALRFYLRLRQLGRSRPTNASNAVIARRLGLQVRSVRRRLLELREIGWVTVTEGADGQRIIDWPSRPIELDLREAKPDVTPEDSHPARPPVAAVTHARGSAEGGRHRSGPDRSTPVTPAERPGPHRSGPMSSGPEWSGKRPGVVRKTTRSGPETEAPKSPPAPPTQTSRPTPPGTPLGHSSGQVLGHPPLPPPTVHSGVPRDPGQGGGGGGTLPREKDPESDPAPVSDRAATDPDQALLWAAADDPVLGEQVARLRTLAQQTRGTDGHDQALLWLEQAQERGERLRPEQLRAVLDAEFVAWWRLVPLQEDQHGARAAWRGLALAGELPPLGALIEPTKAWRAQAMDRARVEREAKNPRPWRYCKRPANWLTAKRWTDRQPETPAVPAKAAHAPAPTVAPQERLKSIGERLARLQQGSEPEGVR